MDWLSKSFEYETAKWEVTDLDTGIWIREDVLMALLQPRPD